MTAIKAKQLDTSGIVQQDQAPALAGNLDVANKKIITNTTNASIELEPNGSGIIKIRGAGGNDGTLQLNCSDNSHGVKIKSPDHNAAANYTLTLPEDTGTDGQILKTDPNGQLSWVDYDGALTYKGTVTLSGYTTSPPTSITGASKGDFFIISGEGFFAGATSKKLRDGDHIVFNQDVGGSLSNAKFDIIDNTGLIDGFESISGTSATLAPRKVYYFASSVTSSTTLTLPDSNTLTTGDIIKLVWVYTFGNAQKELTVTFQGGLGKPGFDHRAFGTSYTFSANSVTNIAGVDVPASVDLKTRGQSITLIYDGNTDKFYAEVGTRFLGQLLDLDLNTDTPSNNDFLKYDGSKWIPGLPGSATMSTKGIVELATNNEAQSATAADKVLTPSNIAYIKTESLDNTAGFISDIASENLSNLSDVNASSPSNGQVLTWDNTKWIAQDASSSAAYASAFSIISTNTTLVTNTRYIVQNTSSVTLTVPDTTSMAYGDSIWLYVDNPSSSANNTTTLTFNSTGSGKPKIQALSSSSGIATAVNQNTAGTISIPVKSGPVELTFHTLSNIPTLFISYSPRSLQNLTDIKTETGSINPNTTLIWDSGNEYYEKSTHAPLANYSTQYVNSTNNNTLSLSSTHNGAYKLLQVTTDDDVIIELPTSSISSFACEIDIFDYKAVNGKLQIKNNHSATAVLYSDRYDYDGNRYDNLTSGSTHNTDRSVKCKLRIFYSGTRYYVIKQDVSQAPLFGYHNDTITTLSRGSELHHTGDSASTTYGLILPPSSELQEGDTFSYSFAKVTGNYTLSFDVSEANSTKLFYNGTSVTAQAGPLTLPHSAGKQELYYRTVTIGGNQIPAFTFITNPDPAVAGGASRPIRHTETSATSITIGGGTGTNAAIGADELERLYIITTTSGDVTVTLPSAVGLDRFKLQIKSATSRTVKIKTVSNQDIDGTDYSTNTLDISAQYDSYTLISDNADWYII